MCDKSFSESSYLRKHKCLHTGEKPFPCKVKLVHNAQERSLTGGWVPYIKELKEQEEFTRKLFDLSNSTITNGGSDMGMSEDTQVSMDTSEGDGGELAAGSEIPERADEEGTEVNTSQQCGMAAAVEEGEECQEVSLSIMRTMAEETEIQKTPLLSITAPLISMRPGMARPGSAHFTSVHRNQQLP
ncbi:zinc finger E-box-binding homeobox 1-like isoform X3 [Scyliorhinus canicula]|uniref:zinc finger E-box-binding homeobox 1-like isoform X3 n=1 Tax=Scyliorhinus canicula TaxID=7830 RepID=UPI0018F41303|nr:zinc finger E-box-binding homeobox 1-like isoform X3 [Scyliorhinus canicula]